MRRPTAIALLGLVGLGCAPFVSACSCSKVAPEPTPTSSSSTPTSSSVASASASASATASGTAATASSLVDSGLPVITAHSGKLERDPSGHLKPSSPMPVDDPSLAPPLPQRDPDMDLDVDDPSRDYVTRYVVATKRYGDKSNCVAYGKSYEKSGRRAVEVRDDPKSSCGGTSDALRDTFLVDVGGDRMSLDQKQGHAPLAAWPDGSDPDSKPKAVLSIEDVLKQKAPLLDELAAMRFTVIRVQMFGRGTYPLVSLAGWRAPLTANVKPEDAKAAAIKLCAANNNLPMSIIAGINRSTTLRVRCPTGEARWDKF